MFKISPTNSTSCILGSQSGFENGLPSLIASFIAAVASSLVLKVPIRDSARYFLPHSSSVLLIYKSYRKFICFPIFIFYRQFRICITNASGKAHTPYFCRAGIYSRRLIGINLSSRREQAPALRCSPIITQIGRENNISAEIYSCVCILSLKIGCSQEGRPLPYNLIIQTSLREEA